MKMKMKKILREPLLYVLPLLAVSVLCMAIIPGNMEFSDAKLTRNNKTENIKLPYSYKTAEGKRDTFSISFNLSVKDRETAKFTIIPDDCIEEISINGEKFPLDGIKGLCSWKKGAYFNFSKNVHKGSNRFELRILNKGGPGGLRIEAEESGGYDSLSIMQYAFALLLLISAILLLRKLKPKSVASGSDETPASGGGEALAEAEKALAAAREAVAAAEKAMAEARK